MKEDETQCFIVLFFAFLKLEFQDVYCFNVL